MIIVYNKKSTILAHHRHTKTARRFESLHPYPEWKDGSQLFEPDLWTIPKSSTKPIPGRQLAVLCVPTGVSFLQNHISFCLETEMEYSDSRPNQGLLAEEIQPRPTEEEAC
mmetsp:Transcript_40164/g.96912  ORF Transcript_40164/g.96912 Transcript_40164/m.96912 type:complete len:111 (-) Transcript_40164:868-1200(-)